MRRVIIESPYAGDVRTNTDYARACVRDSLQRGEAPIASHLLYTQPGILADGVPAERALGIAAGLEWGKVAEATVVYIDRGISRGMGLGIAAAKQDGRPVEYRCLRSAERGYEQPKAEGAPTGSPSNQTAPATAAAAHDPK